jgi:hypothetical protein
MITNQFEDGPLKRRLVTVLWSVTRWLWFLFTDIMAWAVSFLQLQRIACVFLQAHKNFGFVSLQILVPIHQDVHWCLAVINIRDKRIEYLDSLKGVDDTVLQVLVSWPIAITTVISSVYCTSAKVMCWYFPFVRLGERRMHGKRSVDCSHRNMLVPLLSLKDFEKFSEEIEWWC